jgi:hypothetical protein
MLRYGFPALRRRKKISQQYSENENDLLVIFYRVSRNNDL